MCTHLICIFACVWARIRSIDKKSEKMRREFPMLTKSNWIILFRYIFSRREKRMEKRKLMIKKCFKLYPGFSFFNLISNRVGNLNIHIVFWRKRTFALTDWRFPIEFGVTQPKCMDSFFFTTFIRTLLFVDEIAAVVSFRGWNSRRDWQIVREQEKQVK